jgi:uncharacterized LabA/DUF88 family protein
MFYKDERLALFIDGTALYSATRMLGFEVDFKLLHREFVRRGKLMRVGYYTSLVDGEEFNPLRPLIDWLQYNGYAVVTKMAKEYVDSMGRRKVKGNMEVNIAVDAMELAPRIDHAVFFAGDGDLVPLVESMQRQGVRVSIVSTARNHPPIASDELRRQADSFIELDDLRAIIGRPPREVQLERVDELTT